MRSSGLSLGFGIGEGIMTAKQSQVPVSSIAMNRSFVSHGEKRGYKHTASPTFTWLDDPQGSKLVSKVSFAILLFQS